MDSHSPSADTILVLDESVAQDYVCDGMGLGDGKKSRGRKRDKRCLHNRKSFTIKISLA